MKLLHRSTFAWLVFHLGLASLCAQPILLQPQGRAATTGSQISNIRVGKPSADGTEVTLTLDYSYDGLQGQRVRITPVITDKAKPEVSHWFGAETKTVGIASKGTISIKVKFFNDEPGVPPELTTDRIHVIMFNDSGTSVVNEYPILKTIKWGNPNAKPVPTPPPNPVTTTGPSAAQLAEAKLAEEKANAAAAAHVKELQDAVEAKAREATAAEEKLAEEEKHIAADKARGDQAAADKAKVDQAAADKAKVDQAAADKAKVDQAAADKAKADQAAADKARADQAAADKARADQAAADKARADQAAADKAKADQAAADKAKADASRPAPSSATVSFAIAPNLHTKVTGMDIVNRSLDRSEMTIRVDYNYVPADGLGKMGVDLASADDPGATKYFASEPVGVGKNNGPILIPVKFNPPPGTGSSCPTDKVWVYLTGPGGEKSYISSGTMLLTWHASAGGSTAAPVAAAPTSLQLDDFKQDDAFSGHVIVHYNLVPDSGKIHLRVYDSAQPASAGWFASEDAPIKSGPGLQPVKIAVSPSASGPDLFNADTIEITILDKDGKVIAASKTQRNMVWAKPK